MRRRTLEVELNRHASVVRGPGAHALIQEETGRPPCWVARVHGFSVQETTARSVIGRAEYLGYDIVITGERASRKARLLASLEAAPAPRWPQSDPGAGSW